MARRIPEQVMQEIDALYEEGLSVREIHEKTGVSYSSVYGRTQARGRVNPETGRTFQSGTEYTNYLARQRVNPETGRMFGSRKEYENYIVPQRIEKNNGLSSLLNCGLRRLGKNQTWLAEEAGVTRQAVSLYFQGKMAPKPEVLYRIIEALKINDTKKGKNALERWMRKNHII